MIGLCDRWHKTPDEILACDTSTLLRYLDLMKYSREGQDQTAAEGLTAAAM